VIFDERQRETNPRPKLPKLLNIRLPFPCLRATASNFREFETSAIACSVSPARKWVYPRVVRVFRVTELLLPQKHASHS
jgi:hypothetical protein